MPSPLDNLANQTPHLMAEPWDEQEFLNDLIQATNQVLTAMLP